MSEHHPKNVSAVLKWCPTCGRRTLHRVDFKREGSCTEHGSAVLSKAQEKAEKDRVERDQNPTLF